MQCAEKHLNLFPHHLYSCTLTSASPPHPQVSFRTSVTRAIARRPYTSRTSPRDVVYFQPQRQVYALHSLFTASVSPTSLVSNSYSPMPTSTVAALRAHIKNLRSEGKRHFGM